jgi:hypothetical protein
MGKTASQKGREPKRKASKRATNKYLAEYLSQSVNHSRIEDAMNPVKNRPETTQVVQKPKRDTFILLVISVLLLGSGVIWLIYAVF